MKYTLFILVISLCQVSLFQANKTNHNENIKIITQKDSTIAHSIQEAMKNPALIETLFLDSLTYFPSEILLLKNLSELSFYESQFPAFPPEIERLKKLKRLSIDRSKYIPEGLSYIENLTGLELGSLENAEIPLPDRDLTNLKFIEIKSCNPKGISGFSNINYAYFVDVNFDSFSEEVCNWEQLDFLVIEGARLSILPDCISKFPKLEELVLYNTNLTKVPNFLGEMTGLKRLEISHSNISTIPVNLYYDSHLKYLAIKNNKMLISEILKIKPSLIDTIELKQDSFYYSRP